MPKIFKGGYSLKVSLSEGAPELMVHLTPFREDHSDEKSTG